MEEIKQVPVNQVKSRILDVSKLTQYMQSIDELIRLKGDLESLQRKISSVEELKIRHQAMFFRDNQHGQSSSVPSTFVFTYKGRNLLFRANVNHSMLEHEPVQTYSGETTLTPLAAGQTRHIDDEYLRD